MQARELVICGLATDICVQLTAMDAFLREYPGLGAGRLHRRRDARGQGGQPGLYADVLRFDTAAGAPRPPKRKTARRTRS